ARLTRTTLKKFVSMSACACASVTASLTPDSTRPALFTTTSMRPAAAITSATARSTDASSVTSSSTTSAMPRSSRAAAAFFPFTPRIVAKTRKFPPARASAMRRPKPVLAPVMRTMRFESIMGRARRLGLAVDDEPAGVVRLEGAGHVVTFEMRHRVQQCHRLARAFRTRIRAGVRHDTIATSRDHPYRYRRPIRKLHRPRFRVIRHGDDHRRDDAVFRPDHVLVRPHAGDSLRAGGRCRAEDGEV